MQQEEKGRATLGEQVNQATEKQIRSPDQQEVGETLEMLGQGTFLKKLEHEINRARSKGICGKIYVHIIEEPLKEYKNGVKWHYITRRSKPDMTPSSYLYSHNDEDEYPDLVWNLPTLGHMDIVLSNPSLYPAKLVRWVKEYQEWSLEKGKEVQRNLIEKQKQQRSSKLILPANYR